jgi:DNA polymerase I-like protein with 3'-5' exonuclease and polymerase domains
MMNVVMPLDSKAPPWSYVMPKAEYQTYFKEVVSSASIHDLDTSYYENIWIHGNQLLSSLRAAKVDGQTIDKLIAESVHSSSTVSSFTPRAGGYAQPVVYDRFGTVTGRLVVESGPNILLLKKEHRSILRPSTSGGSIVSLDFSALEARILLYESGGTCGDEDLYESIARRVGSTSRSVVKAAVLAELYGSSKNALALTLGMSNEHLSEFIRKVEEVINTKKLLASLKKQFSKEGWITNKYGRRIEVSRPQDNIFVNYYAQSTGVDVSLFGFNKILNDLGFDGIRPLFVLHDALILDVREDRLKDVEGVKSVSVPGYSNKFPLKLETLQG